MDQRVGIRADGESAFVEGARASERTASRALREWPFARAEAPLCTAHKRPDRFLQQRARHSTHNSILPLGLYCPSLAHQESHKATFQHEVGVDPGMRLHCERGKASAIVMGG